MRCLWAPLFILEWPLASAGAADPIEKLAEHVQFLTAVHPVSSANYPDTTEHAVASTLIETHEARIPHHHILKLRAVHDRLRNNASALSEVQHKQDHSLIPMGG